MTFVLRGDYICVSQVAGVRIQADVLAGKLRGRNRFRASAAINLPDSGVLSFERSRMFFSGHTSTIERREIRDDAIGQEPVNFSPI